jgi:Zn-dependent protease
MNPEQLLLLPVWYAVFLLSVTCHEAAHAWVAYRGGDETAYRGGQVTLNPLPHIQREPFGTVLVPLLTYFSVGWMMGWASAPYDPAWEERYPRRAAAMAAAGPAANLLLALLAFLALRIGLGAEIWAPASGEMFAIDRLVLPLASEAGAIEGLGRFCSLLLFLNLLLFLFNLIPLPPLDGAAVAAGLLPAARDLRDRLRASGMGGLLGLVVAIYAIRWIFSPVYGRVLDLLFLGI